MKRIINHPETRLELREAAEYYKAENPRAAKEFAREVRATMQRIGNRPETGSPGELGTRRKYVRRFPYTIIYRIKPHHIDVLAVMHQRREPGYWHHRL